MSMASILHNRTEKPGFSIKKQVFQIEKPGLSIGMSHFLINLGFSADKPS